MKKIKLKLTKGKVALALVLVVVIAVGVAGTVIGIKSAIEEKEYQELLNPTSAPKVDLDAEAKVFSCDGFSLELTENFETKEDSAVELGCTSTGIEVYLISDEFKLEDVDSDLSAYEYLKDIVDSWNDGTTVQDYNGIPFTTYKYVGESNSILKEYRVFCFKGADRFWLLHFVTEYEYIVRYDSYISAWVDSVEYK